MGTQSSLWRPGACSMLALALTVCLLVCANGSRLPASSEQVMPKLHLAYLVEDVEYPRPEELQASNEELPHSSRVKRQSSPLAVNNQDVEAEDEKTSALAGRNAALSAAILRVLEVANAKPTPVELSGSYSGKKRRSAQLEPVHSNAHQYGLLEPKVELVKVKSHGNFGKVVQASDVAPSPHHAKLEHGRKKRSDVNFDNFVPFSVYDDRRVKLLKVEENDFHALPRVIASNKKKRADLEKVEEEEAKVHVVQLTADQ